MNRILVAMMCCLSASAAVRAAGSETKADGAWPQWRGPAGTGAAKKANPPVEWSETKNIRWKPLSRCFPSWKRWTVCTYSLPHFPQKN